MMLKTKTTISENDFKALAATMDFNCVSLYCSLKGDVNTIKTTFLELIKTTQQKLRSKNILGESYYNIIKPLEQLINDTDFWKQDIIEQKKTFVVFLNENNMTSCLVNRELSSGVYVAANYYLLPLFNSVTSQQLQQDSSRIKQVVLNEDMTTNRLEKIIPLAYEGKIDTLYVSSKNGVYGVYDPVNKTTMIDSEKNENNVSLINLAAITTYMFNGKVFVIDPIDMPTKGVSIQAILKK